MDDSRKYLEPEEMTPEERMERIVELLAKAASDPKLTAEGTDTLKPYSEKKLFCVPPKSGPIPFGKKLGDNGLVTKEEEAFWIKRIQELTGQGYSTEKIAKRLNEEDHKTKRAGKRSRTAVWRILKAFENKKGVTD